MLSREELYRRWERCTERVPSEEMQSFEEFCDEYGDYVYHSKF